MQVNFEPISHELVTKSNELHYEPFFTFIPKDVDGRQWYKWIDEWVSIKCGWNDWPWKWMIMNA